MESTHSKQQEKPNQTNNQNKTKQEKRKKEKRNKSSIRRIFPIWLRLIVIFLLAFLALIVGMMLGFSVLGEGEPLDVLMFDFWRHVLDVITGVE